MRKISGLRRISMRVASTGNYNVVGTNRETNCVIYPFYDGFKTKREALDIANKLATVDNKHTYSVIKNK